MKNVENFLRVVDQVFDELISSLGITDDRDATLMSWWQNGDRPGYRLQVTRKRDGKSKTRFVDAATANVCA